MTSDTPNQNSTPPPSGPPPPNRSCAACKNQRRRCADDCLFRPYFPPHSSQEFTNVHDLFGIKNVQKLMEKVPESYRDDAMTSLIYEANIRAIYPVGGCMAVVSHLYNQVSVRENELNEVYRNLALVREWNLEAIRAFEQMQSGITDQIGGNLERIRAFEQMQLGTTDQIGGNSETIRAFEQMPLRITGQIGGNSETIRAFEQMPLRITGQIGGNLETIGALEQMPLRLTGQIGGNLGQNLAVNDEFVGHLNSDLAHDESSSSLIDNPPDQQLLEQQPCNQKNRGNNELNK